MTAEERERLQKILAAAAQAAYDEVIEMQAGKVVAQAAYHAVKSQARIALSAHPTPERGGE